VIALFALGACSGRGKSTPDLAPASTAVAKDGRAQATSSLRCEECHARVAHDWTVSAHAAAVRDPLYLAILEGGDDRGCVDCHAPLKSSVPSVDPVAREGVGCDGCHLIAAVDEGTPPRHRWAAHGDTKYGPLCDAEDHYFHKMGCSKPHGSASFCAPCHEWRRGDLPLLTDWSDWKAGPKAEEGLECQSCHMPSIDDEIARGGKRLKLHDHRFSIAALGEAAITIAVSVVERHVRIELTNTGAGHAIPAGMPERRLVVRMAWFDAHGREVMGEQRELGRVLVDAEGQVAPFPRAVRVAEDRRILPGKSTVVDHLPPPSAVTQVEVTLKIVSVAKELEALQFRVTEQKLKTQRFALGARK
jgi:hypothetical protein